MIRLGACLLAMVFGAGTAFGQFSIGSVDFGGGFEGTNGSPLVPSGGSLHALQSTDSGTYALFSYEDWADQGWGITFGGIENNALETTPDFYGSALLDVNETDAVLPAGGAGAATSSSFGGYYERGLG